jgi:hypothetical protein
MWNLPFFPLHEVKQKQRRFKKGKNLRLCGYGKRTVLWNVTPWSLNVSKELPCLQLWFLLAHLLAFVSSGPEGEGSIAIRNVSELHLTTAALQPIVTPVRNLWCNESFLYKIPRFVYWETYWVPFIRYTGNIFLSPSSGGTYSVGPYTQS